MRTIGFGHGRRAKVREDGGDGKRYGEEREKEGNSQGEEKLELHGRLWWWFRLWWWWRQKLSNSRGKFFPKVRR